MPHARDAVRWYLLHRDVPGLVELVNTMVQWVGMDPSEVVDLLNEEVDAMPRDVRAWWHLTGVGNEQARYN